MKKPIFFISSTIYDFKDLRYSIKWWLEENGYIVNASEYNDFKKPLDKHSYEACLNTIDNSDYFILLIGDRIGGMYDDEITITQKEYQFAYEKVLKGEMKIISFIRQTTWDNFNCLKKKVLNLEINENYDKSFIEKIYTKEERIRSKFIDEVRRIEEMINGKRPINNWIHQFNTFRDISVVLSNELGGQIDLNFKQIRFIVLNTIKENLKSILVRRNGKTNLKTFLNIELFDNYTLTFENQYLNLSEKQKIDYLYFFFENIQTKTMKLDRIDSFYKNGYFLEYDKHTNDYVNGKLNQLIKEIIECYDIINLLHNQLYREDNFSRNKENEIENKINELKIYGKKSTLEDYYFSEFELYTALRLNDLYLNCSQLSINIYKALSDLDFEVPTLINNYRLSEKTSKGLSEIVTDNDVYQFLNT